MSDEKPATGMIAWNDLTVQDAEGIRDFYSSLLGWEAKPVSQGEYNDYNMVPPGSDRPAAGIIHARGVNASIPPQWMIYVVVEDLQATVDRCIELGGRVIAWPEHEGVKLQNAFLQDPAGAVFAVWQPGEIPAEG